MPAAALAAFLALALLCLGSASAVGHNFVVVACGLTAAVALLLGPEDWPTYRWTSLILLLAFPALTAIQFAAAVLIGTSTASIGAICGSLALLLGYVLFFTTSLNVATRPRGARTLIGALVLIGFLESVYGVFNLLSGNPYLLLFKRWAYADSATGTLVNRNHFAYLLEMTIPLGIAVVATRLVQPARGRSRATEEKAKGAMQAIAVAFMVLGLLLSRSRMGMFSLAIAATSVLLLDRVVHTPTRTTRVQAGRGVGLVLVGVTGVFLAGIGIDVAFERFSSATSDLEVGRVPIWRDTWTMILAHPLLGSGFGTYEYAIAAYRPEPSGFSYVHAHSEYLQILAETGVAGLVVVASWIGAFLRRLVVSLSGNLDPVSRAYVLATATGILAVTIHSVLDFGLRIPAIALTFCMIVALFVRLSAPPTATGAWNPL